MEGCTTRRVQSGDTLIEIAYEYGLDLYGLLKMNPQIRNADHIQVGEPINVPLSAVEPTKDLGLESVQNLPLYYQIALGEMAKGVKEKRGDLHNDDILKYHASTTLGATDDETPWCSSFVNWCVEQAGLSGTKSAAARSWLNWGETLSEPTIGCIVVLRRGNKPWQGHVGFVHDIDSAQVAVLGGNQSNKICINYYLLETVLGWRL